MISIKFSKFTKFFDSFKSLFHKEKKRTILDDISDNFKQMHKSLDSIEDSYSKLNRVLKLEEKFSSIMSEYNYLNKTTSMKQEDRFYYIESLKLIIDEIALIKT